MHTTKKQIQLKINWRVYDAVPAVARAKAAGVASIVVGDHNYGEGSSEHAAMEPRFLE
jgi:aconitate hydratase